ncbi:GEM-like protein 7 [Populus alba x Populus x berolinensis]|uniref:GRAM domain-containing protein n=3 Tax=Populus TaxID=3689 RepID=A0A4U5N7L9_POPAL|nr:GEM-like protein 7 [Populus alba]KAG6775501.1 hypothetical protein POTOM_018957 [Populus tomentosa]KAJ6929495.1 GEM-like protein 7 [Populus alba x Populus x berolinensis]KAJ6996755.1 GEM-like protein 7 [Populus alba x Populus x berolinensis]TKR78658.1 hypothetical protein D5086_0000279740 [Populus alba]
MKNTFQDQALGIPINSAAYTARRSPLRFLPGPDGQYPQAYFKQCKAEYSMLKMMNKLGKKADNFANGVREHVRLGPKISETVKGKLSLGAKILQVGGVEKIFKQLFVVSEDEKLLKASQCYLSTTAGPIAGLLFVSTEKVAFCSERSIKISSPSGKSVRVHYKVLVPLKKIKMLNQSENVKKPSQKYLELVTVDDFDFWFMGFINYQKTFKYLQQAVSQISDEINVAF